MKRFVLTLGVLCALALTIGCSTGPGVSNEEEAKQALDTSMTDIDAASAAAGVGGAAGTGDAGTGDAGTGDAGTGDAGTGDAAAPGTGDAGTP